jgi:hypothetical protein
LAIGPKHYSAFDRTDLSGFDRTTTVKLPHLAAVLESARAVFRSNSPMSAASKTELPASLPAKQPPQ